MILMPAFCLSFMDVDARLFLYRLVDGSASLPQRTEADRSIGAEQPHGGSSLRRADVHGTGVDGDDESCFLNKRKQLPY